MGVSVGVDVSVGVGLDVSVGVWVGMDVSVGGTGVSVGTVVSVAGNIAIGPAVTALVSFKSDVGLPAGKLHPPITRLQIPNKIISR